MIRRWIIAPAVSSATLLALLFFAYLYLFFGIGDELTPPVVFILLAGPALCLGGAYLAFRGTWAKAAAAYGAALALMYASRKASAERAAAARAHARILAYPIKLVCANGGEVFYGYDRNELLEPNGTPK